MTASGVPWAHCCNADRKRWLEKSAALMSMASVTRQCEEQDGRPFGLEDLAALLHDEGTEFVELHTRRKGTAEFVEETQSSCVVGHHGGCLAHAWPAEALVSMYFPPSPLPPSSEEPAQRSLDHIEREAHPTGARCGFRFHRRVLWATL
jgi:hypothetical protein